MYSNRLIKYIVLIIRGMRGNRAMLPIAEDIPLLLYVCVELCVFLFYSLERVDLHKCECIFHSVEIIQSVQNCNHRLWFFVTSVCVTKHLFDTSK